MSKIQENLVVQFGENEYAILNHRKRNYVTDAWGQEKKFKTRLAAETYIEVELEGKQ